jgi:hypothetical protein
MITGANFKNNSAVVVSGIGAQGGAVAYKPYDTGTRNPSLTVTGTTFAGNSAGVGTAGVLGDGGALVFGPSVTANSTASLNVSQSSFSGDTAGTQGASGRGGAIAIESGGLPAGAGAESITLDRDSFDHEAAGGGGAVPVGPHGEGGAIDDLSQSLGNQTLTLSDSTLSNNSAGGQSPLWPGIGGGIDIDPVVAGGSVILRNDTITGNSADAGATAPATGLGGGVNVDAATVLPATFDNDTITGNTVGGTAKGGGVAGPAAIKYQNTVVAGNTGAAGADCGTAASSSGGGNVESGTSCGFTGTGDHRNADPKLGSLQNNGGPNTAAGNPLQTMLPLPGSPVLGAGIAGNCPSTDERGFARPAASACDSGATQVQRGAATTGAASLLGGTIATVTGTASPSDAATTASFEYGTSTSYGSKSSPRSVTHDATPVTAKLTKLKPGTVYHYRLVVTSPYGSINGADRTFTTLSPPKNIKRPKISGKPRVGAKLKCSRGKWSGHPTRFRYQWKRNGKKIKHATKARHKVTTKDAGKKLTCTVAATNAAGTATATSRPVRVRLPARISLP